MVDSKNRAIKDGGQVHAPSPPLPAAPGRLFWLFLHGGRCDFKCDELLEQIPSTLWGKLAAHVARSRPGRSERPRFNADLLCVSGNAIGFAHHTCDRRVLGRPVLGLPLSILKLRPSHFHRTSIALSGSTMFFNFSQGLLRRQVVDQTKDQTKDLSI